MTTRSPTGGGVVEDLAFAVSDVTGSRRMEFHGVDGHRSAGEVAASIANAMDLPTNVPWSLRDELRAAMLDPTEALGSQVQPNAELVVIPQAHMG